MRKGITYLPHTADIKVLLEGEHIEDLFSLGVDAINDILKPGFCDEGPVLTEKIHIELSAPDRTVLLIDFLSDVLSYSLTNHVIYCQVEELVLHGLQLKGSLSGATVQFFEEEIKAVTYHEAEVRQKANGSWTTLVLFDI